MQHFSEVPDGVMLFALLTVMCFTSFKRDVTFARMLWTSIVQQKDSFLQRSHFVGLGEKI